LQILGGDRSAEGPGHFQALAEEGRVGQGDYVKTAFAAVGQWLADDLGVRKFML
jgi:hypothetical protein